MERKGSRKLVLTTAVAAYVFASGTAFAAERATAKEAEVIAKEPRVLIKANGKDKGYVERVDESTLVCGGIYKG